MDSGFKFVLYDFSVDKSDFKWFVTKFLFVCLVPAFILS